MSSRAIIRNQTKSDAIRRTVRAHDAHDAARRKLEGQTVDQRAAIEALLEVLGLNHKLAEPRACGENGAVVSTCMQGVLAPLAAPW